MSNIKILNTFIINMQDIVFATNNSHKLEEIRRIFGGKFRILSLKEIGCEDDIPETADTLEGNAIMKARYVKQHYGYDCFADDTGLMVNALDGAPGVYSARYAGPGHDSVANMSLLLKIFRASPTAAHGLSQSSLLSLTESKRHSRDRWKAESSPNHTVRTDSDTTRFSSRMKAT